MLDQDVQSRVDAYRGNPQALQQKYSVSKDLLDLMALQKLTKEKESAARELQMAMAAQQGQGAGTIRDQLQQKALGMTKQELEKQQMELLQQKQQQQQQNLQQIAQSGIAQNPAPNMEAAPGFASGGIIAFAGGTEVPEPDAVKALRKKMEDAGYNQQTIDKAIREGSTGQGINLTPNPIRMTPGPTNPAQRDPAQALREFTQISPAQTSRVAPPAVTQGVPAAVPAAAPVQQVDPFTDIAFPKETAAPTQERRPPPPPPERKPRPAPAVTPVGIATLPVTQAAPTAPQVAAPVAPTAPQAAAPQENKYAARLMADLDQAQENPGASRQQIIQQFLAQHGLTPEERADRTKYQESLRARHAALSDPEELRRERLKQTLLGMAGASNAGIALARGAAAGQNYEAGRNAEALKTLEQLQGINEGETAARRKALETSYGLGAREGESVRNSESSRFQAALTGLGGLARTESDIAAQERIIDKKIKADLEAHGLDNASREKVAAATNQTSKEVERIRGQFHNQAAGISAAASDRSSAANREVAYARLIEDSRTRLTASLAKTESDIERSIMMPHKGLYDAIALTGKANPEQQKQLDKIEADIKVAKATARNAIQTELDRLGLSKYGIGIGADVTSGGGGGGEFKIVGTRPQ